MATITESSSSPLVPKYPTLFDYGQAVLNTHDTLEKCELVYEAYDLFNIKGTLPLGDQINPPQINDIPARPLNLVVVPVAETGKVRGDSRENNHLRLIHSQAHIESYAIDLSIDIINRFANFRCVDGSLLPRDYFFDWLKVAYDECLHFTTWSKRLVDLGSHYGAFPTHDALWESAFRTKDDILARLSVVHMVHESHGLDVGPRLMNQFLGFKDKQSADFFRVITEDEITHVAAGVRWYNHITAKIIEKQEQENDGEDKNNNNSDDNNNNNTNSEKFDKIAHFHRLVEENFHGSPRPPFNHEARLRAGMTPNWYEPLVKIRPDGQKLNVKELMMQRKEKRAQQQKQTEENGTVSSATPPQDDSSVQNINNNDLTSE